VGSTPDARSRYRLISVKLTARDIPETLEAIDRISADSATGAESPPERFFLNQYIQNLYLVVLREAQALGAFAAVAIVLACLGLVGLSAATAESRTREIGIRKAMGAGSSDILRMLLWQFSKPILWANLVAWPVSALLLNRWLEGFADHIDLSPLTFVAAGALALIIAVATVASHATLVARARPVEALRYE
jgi:putative ABC transport system permease protein